MKILRKIMAWWAGWSAYANDPVGLSPAWDEDLNDAWWRGWQARQRWMKEDR